MGYKGVNLCPLLIFLVVQKEWRLAIPALPRTEKNPSGERYYTTKSERKELSYRGNPLPTPLSSNRISSTFPFPDSFFPNSVLRWKCCSLPRRYFPSPSLVLSLESFPQNLISIRLIVNWGHCFLSHHQQVQKSLSCSTAAFTYLYTLSLHYSVIQSPQIFSVFPPQAFWTSDPPLESP